MAREARKNKGQQTLFQVGLIGPNTLQVEDYSGLSVTEELEEAAEKPGSSVNSVCEKVISKERGAGVITEEINKEVSLENANSDSDVGNAKSVGAKVSEILLSDGSRVEDLHYNCS